LLAEALELPQPERELYVLRSAADDAELRELVLRLLRRLDTDRGRATAPPAAVVEAAFGSRDEELDPGSIVAERYEIIAHHARGGMATVYEAERADGVYSQRVALKVLRRGLDTDDLVARFRAERQILSSLAHPNIARLLDGGALEDGRPFLVMELVEGEPVTTYAERRNLSTRHRLALALGVADAVHAAHRQLVVHRDIKPSNILVDPEGQVKLLDFGIAKLLAADPAETGIPGTEGAAVALTPEYASPEQLAGGAITTATDVYQLGLLLRELLTGTRPSRAPSRASPANAIRASSPRRIDRDLETIITKALREEPEERYSSAAEFAADIRRYLRGLPILAHPESTRYRIRKFVRRHRWATTAAAAGVILVIGYALTVTVQSRRIAAERDRAEQEATKAERVTEFLVQLFHGADPNLASGRDVTARELLDEGARQITAGLNEQPEVRAAILAAIGRSYQQLGMFSEASKHLRQAVEERRAAGASSRVALARDLTNLAAVVAPSDRTQARQLLQEALLVGEEHAGPNDPLIAAILTHYANLVGTDDPQVAGMSERAIVILRAAPGDVRRELATALKVSAYGKPPDVAIPQMREALELLRSVYGERHTSVAYALSDLALATEQTDPLAADSLMQEALDMLIAIHGLRHAAPLRVMDNLAALRRDRGAYAAAKPLYEEVLALRQELYPDQRRGRAYTLYGLGVVLCETGAPAEGERRLREALRILRGEDGTAAHAAVTSSAIGHALARQGRYAQAEALLLSAHAELQSQAGPWERAKSIDRIAVMYEAWGRPMQAREYRVLRDSLLRAERLTGFTLLNN
jgi:eukaryotic-like serine/threonine-protein kinase